MQDPAAVERRVELALRMLDHGAWVFPLARNSKMPLVPKAQGGKGFLDARPDRDMAQTFLRNPGQPNYGVVFPEGSDIFVLDLDGGGDNPRPEWREDWQKLYERYGPPGLTFIVRTPSGGRHAYYRWRSDLYGPMPAGDEMLGWTVRKPWKGYLVGPGSIVNGVAYETAGIETIADFPQAWSEAARGEKLERPTRSTITVGGTKGPAQVQKGHRHAFLRDRARYLVGLGLSGDALFTAVMDLNNKLAEPKAADDVRRAIGEAETLFEPDEVTETGGRPERFEDELSLLPPSDSGNFPADPDPIVYGGLLGDCVMDLAPSTDASLAALLGALIAFSGMLVPGYGLFYRRHTSSAYIALVGESSVGRKGTAMTRVHDALAAAIEPTYVNRVIADGLNSGEALVSHLHYKATAFVHEPNVALVYGEEYAGLMAARQREGSTLDPKMREAFDGGPLSNRRSNAADTKPVDANSYWVGALVGITPNELRARQEAGAMQSGSANRWLYLPVTRREVSPSNGEPRFSPENAAALIKARRQALEEWKTRVSEGPTVIRTLGAYDDHLRRTSSGLALDLTRRFSAIAYRIALIHALADRSREISRSHLDRAIGLTEYARSGIRWVFGDTVGSPDADLLARHLMDSGRLSKTAITREIIRDPIRRQAAIDELVRLKVARVARLNGTGGRSRTELVRVLSPFSAISSFSVAEHYPETVEKTEESDQSTWKEVEESARPHLEQSGRNGKEATPTSTWCHFFVDHQHQHRDVSSDPWCEICSPREGK